MSKGKSPLQALDSDVNKTTEDGDSQLFRPEDYTGHKLGFDPFAPVDLTAADLHQQCKLVRDLRQVKTGKNLRACECCGLPLVRNKQDAPMMPLWTSVKSLEDLGPGMPQYFWLVKYLMLVMLVTCALAGIPPLIEFSTADHYSDWDQNENWAIVISAGNKGDRRIREDIIPLWQSILHIVAMALILLSYLFVRRWLNRQEDIIDADTITASDYTVWIKGLPKEYKNEELISYLERAGRADGKPCSVVKINVPIDIREFVAAVRDVNSIKRKLLQLDRQGTRSTCCAGAPTTKDQLESQMVDALSKVSSIEALYSAQDTACRRLPMAFVTLKTQDDAAFVCDNLGTNFIQRFFQRVCGHGSFESEEFQGKRIHGVRPPDPSDIIWENLSVRLVSRLKNMAVTSAVTLVMLGLCGGMIYGCSYYKRQLYEDNKNKTSTLSADRLRYLVTSILPAVGVILINFVLSRCIRLFSLYEKPHTSTQYNSSVALKLVLAMCINTALIAILVDYDRDDGWFTPGGLVVQMTYIYISNAVVTPLFYILSPMYLLRVVRRCRIRRAPGQFFQGDANAVFEGPPVDLAQRYANVLKTLIISFAYAPIVPIGLLIGLIALVIEYWVDKTLLLRRHARPQRISGDLNRSMIRILPWAVVVYAVMLFVFMEQLNPDYSGAAFVWMWITLAIALFPTSSFRICCKRQWDGNAVRAGDTKEFEEVALELIEDFDRMNPVTQREGWGAYLKLVEKKKLLDQKIQQAWVKRLGEGTGLLGNYAQQGYGGWQGPGMWNRVNPLQQFQAQLMQRIVHPAIGAIVQAPVSYQATRDQNDTNPSGVNRWLRGTQLQPPPPANYQGWVSPQPSFPSAPAYRPQYYR